MIAQYKHPISEKYNTPASENLFKINKHSPKFIQRISRRVSYNSSMWIIVAKRARTDIQPTIAFLCTRVRDPTKDDSNKLARLMSYLKLQRMKH